MKKIFLILIVIVITSCSSSNHVCGGSGGKRCVETSAKTNTDIVLDS
jgi:hypothetical protein